MTTLQTDPLRQYGHQAVITSPSDNATVTTTSGRINASGYAIRATRVEAIAIPSTTCTSPTEAQDAAEREPSKRWTAATVRRGERPSERDAWQLWTAEVDVGDADAVWLVCRACASSSRIGGIGR